MNIGSARSRVCVICLRLLRCPRTVVLHDELSVGERQAALVAVRLSVFVARVAEEGVPRLSPVAPTMQRPSLPVV